MQEENESKTLDQPEPIEISFSGSGWLLYYQLGVACALQEAGYISSPSTNIVRYVGSSGGAVVAAMLALDFPIVTLQPYFLDHSLEHLFSDPVVNVLNTKQYLEKALKLPQMSEYYAKSTERMKKGHLAVVVTTIPEAHSHLEIEFETKEEVIQGVLASCALFPIGGAPFRYKKHNNEKMDGKYVYDGGVINMLAKSNEYPSEKDELGQTIQKTITVAAFRTMHADIKPSVHLPVWWGMNPPSKRQMRKVFRLGVRNGLEYLVDQSFITPSDLLEVTVKVNQIYKNTRHTQHNYFPVEKKQKYYTDSSATSVSTDSVSSFEIFPDPGLFSLSPTVSINRSYPTDQTRSATTDKDSLMGKLWRAGGLGSKLADKGLEVAFHGCKLLLSEVEQRRRKMFPFPSRTSMSIRLWIPNDELSITAEEKEEEKEELRKNFDELIQMLNPEEMKKMWEESNVSDSNMFWEEIKHTKTFQTLYPIV